MQTTFNAVLIMALICGPVSGQTLVFQEGFDTIGPDTGTGPGGLLADGWQFKTMVLGNSFADLWKPGPVIPNFSPPPAQGTSYLESYVSYNGFGVHQHARWIVLPDIPGLGAGQQMQFKLSGFTGEFNDSFEVRLSPSGGASTGTLLTDVGDFTQSLWVGSGSGGNPWRTVNVPIPSDGRLAFRWIETAFNSGTSMACQIDDLKIEGTPAIPIPLPGQTVHWTLGLSPIVISNLIEIPPGGTVVVDPGVSIVLNDNLMIDGVVDMQGTPTEPITVGSAASPKGAILTRWGELRMQSVSCSVIVQGMTNAFESKPSPLFVAQDSSFHAGGGVQWSLGCVGLRGCSFEDAVLHASDSFLLVDGVSLSNTVLQIDPSHLVGPTLLSGVDASGFSNGAPIEVGGGNVFIDADCSLVGNKFSIRLAGGGLSPGSTLPSSGNTNNLVEVLTPRANGRIDFPKVGPDYLIRNGGQVELGGHLKVWPGVRMKMDPGAFYLISGSWEFETVGRPGQPIVFEPSQPGVPWLTLKYAISTSRPHPRFCEYRFADRALHIDELAIRVDDCLFENNANGGFSTTGGEFVARGSRFFNNQFGVQTSIGPNGFPPLAGFADLDGSANPNWFQGNTKGFEIQNAQVFLDASYNFWGHSSGPKHPSNPGGLGDSADETSTIAPWRFTPPQKSNHTPLVELTPISYYQDRGSKVILRWAIENDDAIVSQRLLWSPHSENPDLTVLVDNIDPAARTIEVAIPENVPSSNTLPGVFRVEAVDTFNQVGFDELLYHVPIPNPWALANVNVAIPASVARCGEAFPFVGEMTLTGPPTSVLETRYIVVDDLDHHEYFGLSSTITMPAISTDTARMLKRWDVGNDLPFYGFSDYFSIRPHDNLGDAPPNIALLSPTTGAQVPGGSTLNVAWTASDDDFVRSIDIQASYDGGRFWNWIERDLPGSATDFAWGLPPSTGIDDVRIRVIARDKRFQASSATSGAIVILPGTTCFADCDGSGTPSIDDFICFQTLFALGDPGADCDSDGSLSIDDFICFQTLFALGC